ncbi:MAG: hypothetical protein ACYDDF_05500 [Thermoplasmatota archaeon]
MAGWTAALVVLAAVVGVLVLAILVTSSRPRTGAGRDRLLNLDLGAWR